MTDDIAGLRAVHQVRLNRWDGEECSYCTCPYPCDFVRAFDALTARIIVLEDGIRHLAHSPLCGRAVYLDSWCSCDKRLVSPKVTS